MCHELAKSRVRRTMYSACEGIGLPVPIAKPGIVCEPPSDQPDEDVHAQAPVPLVVPVPVVQAREGATMPHVIPHGKRRIRLREVRRGSEPAPVRGAQRLLQVPCLGILLQVPLDIVHHPTPEVWTPGRRWGWHSEVPHPFLDRDRAPEVRPADRHHHCVALCRRRGRRWRRWGRRERQRVTAACWVGGRRRHHVRRHRRWWCWRRRRWRRVCRLCCAESRHQSKTACVASATLHLIDAERHVNVARVTAACWVSRMWQALHPSPLELLRKSHDPRSSCGQSGSLLRHTLWHFAHKRCHQGLESAACRHSPKAWPEATAGMVGNNSVTTRRPKSA